MATRIDKKIVGYKVGDTEEAGEGAVAAAPAPAEVEAEDNVVQLHEKLERPEMLIGSTYKVKTPLSEHALYVTINDIILNQGTEHELRRPFEIFINSKNMDHFQWIVALTRIISAVFRKGGDVTFLVEELHSVFDPRGGYLKKGGRFMPSLVAEIGDVVEQHLKTIGILPDEVMDERTRAFIDEKLGNPVDGTGETSGDAEEDSSFPSSAEICQKCMTKALVYLDGCLTCLNCGDSKCG